MTLFAPIAAITVLSFVFGELLKLFPLPSTKVIPVATMLMGGALGALASVLGILGLGEVDVITAAATGIISGLASSGGFSLIKNISGKYDN